MSHETEMKRHAKAVIKAEKHLTAAAAALGEMYRAACAAGLPVKGADDGRLTLQRECSEYAQHLSIVAINNATT